MFDAVKKARFRTLQQRQDAGLATADELAELAELVSRFATDRPFVSPKMAINTCCFARTSMSGWQRQAMTTVRGPPRKWINYVPIHSPRSIVMERTHESQSRRRRGYTVSSR